MATAEWIVQLRGCLPQLIEDLRTYFLSDDREILPLVIGRMERLLEAVNRPTPGLEECQKIRKGFGRILMEDMVFAESDLGKRCFDVINLI